MWCVRLFLLLHAFGVLQAYGHDRRHYSSPQHQQQQQQNTRWSKSLQATVKLRHSGHSKYPHLDGALGRPGKYRSTTTTSTPRSRSRYFSKKYGSNRWDDISENYDDEFDYQDNGDELTKQDYEENADEYEDEDELEEDEDTEDEEEEHMQAEEATQAPAPTSLLTQYKWLHYGTRNRVEESRRNQMLQEQQHQQPMYSSEDAARNAVDHIRRINFEGKCSQPRAKVVSVQSEHPNPVKRYLPHCTVLYRCSEDTGCCPTPDTKCQPKKQTLVHLYFYTSQIGHIGSKVEKLSFHNHTECGCLKIGTAPEVETSPENLRATRSGLMLRNGPSIHSLNSVACTCPEIFLSKIRHDGKCICDCGQSNADCHNMKRGKEHFSLKDRKCILDEKCGVPACEYGAYLRNRGRCPRKQEKLDAYASITTTRPNPN